MGRMALFSIECFASGRAVINFIEEHHQDLAVVVTSNRYGKKNGGVIKQAIANYQRSGLRFLGYLTYQFVLYFVAIRFSQLTAMLGKRKRQYFTIAEMCQSYGIRFINTDNVNSNEVISQLSAENVDLIVVYFFDQVLRPRLIGLPARGVINVHEAYLPACRGLFPVLYSAIKNGGKFGITVHEIIDVGIDSGPILAQRQVEVPENRSILYLDCFINQAGIELVSEVLKDLDLYRSQVFTQKDGSYFSFPTREDIADVKRLGHRLTSLREFMGEVFS
jgi:methionyl-tRNA formyltransferase